MDKREAGCAKKVRYQTRKEAKKASKTVKELHRITGLHPYRCEFCEQWHLGHREPGAATYKRYDFISEPRRL